MVVAVLEEGGKVELARPLYLGQEFAVVELVVGRGIQLVASRTDLPVRAVLVPQQERGKPGSPVLLCPAPRPGPAPALTGWTKCGYETECVLRQGVGYMTGSGETERLCLDTRGGAGLARAILPLPEPQDYVQVGRITVNQQVQVKAIL